jgi:hypothetical protein
VRQEAIQGNIIVVMDRIIPNENREPHRNVWDGKTTPDLNRPCQLVFNVSAAAHHILPVKAYMTAPSSAFKGTRDKRRETLVGRDRRRNWTAIEICGAPLVHVVMGVGLLMS